MTITVTPMKLNKKKLLFVTIFALFLSTSCSHKNLDLSEEKKSLKKM